MSNNETKVVIEVREKRNIWGKIIGCCFIINGLMGGFVDYQNFPEAIEKFKKSNPRVAQMIEEIKTAREMSDQSPFKESDDGHRFPAAIMTTTQAPTIYSSSVGFTGPAGV